MPLFFELKNGAGRARGGPTIGARGMEEGAGGDFSSGLFVDLCPSGVFVLLDRLRLHLTRPEGKPGSG